MSAAPGLLVPFALLSSPPMFSCHLRATSIYLLLKKKTRNSSPFGSSSSVPVTFPLSQGSKPRDGRDGVSQKGSPARLENPLISAVRGRKHSWGVGLAGRGHYSSLKYPQNRARPRIPHHAAQGRNSLFLGKPQPNHTTTLALPQAHLALRIGSSMSQCSSLQTGDEVAEVTSSSRFTFLGMRPSSGTLAWHAECLGFFSWGKAGLRAFFPVSFQLPQTELLVGARQGDGHFCVFFFKDRQIEGRGCCLSLGTQT